jgi:integrase
MARPRLDRPNYRLAPDPKSGNLVIRWTDDARVTRSVSTGTSDRRKAQVALDQFLAGLEAEPRPDNPTIGQILDHYVNDRKGVVASDGHEWACKAIKRHIGNLKPEHLERKLYWRKRAADGVGDGTIIKEVGVLRRALVVAAKDKLIKATDIPAVDQPSRPASREIWMTKEEGARLRRAAAVPHVRLFIALGLATGARKEAIEELLWNQLDLDRAICYLDPPGRKQTKKRRSTVPLTPAMVRYLRRHRAISLTNHVLEWRGQPAGNVKKGFAAAVKRAGLPKHITPHVMRHSVATWMVEANIPTREIARFIGDTEEMIEKVYGHHRPDYLRRAAAALAW